MYQVRISKVPSGHGHGHGIVKGGWSHGSSVSTLYGLIRPSATWHKLSSIHYMFILAT